LHSPPPSVQSRNSIVDLFTKWSAWAGIWKRRKKEKKRKEKKRKEKRREEKRREEKRREEKRRGGGVNCS
uniref:Uncharacterized protein n=1 Tax=Mustela putorius furo TaxID=9669 RepID=M3YF94_MUSPF